jgi:hypothetical protein
VASTERRRPRTRVSPACLALTSIALVSGCGHRDTAPRLEKSEDEDVAIPRVPEPPALGPKLGALANVTPILDRPSKRGLRIGTLHAGETVVRAAEPFSTRGCDGGWFPVRPRGFVCATGSATIDLAHPTLVAMAIQAQESEPLPYTYARTVRDTTLFEPDGARENAVRPLGTLRAKSGMAIVGSWAATDPSGDSLRLAMMSDGHLVPAGDLEAAAPSEFQGAPLGEETKLPVAFVVKRGVRAWAFRGDAPEKHDLLGYHARLDLSGRNRTAGGVEFWATSDGRWVRLPDVTLVRERHEFPPFATEDRKWIDLSVVTGALVAYEGTRPVFATLASVGRDRLGAPESSAVTQRGELEIVGKYVTVADRDPNAFTDGVSIYDAPWALELSSGQLLLGAYWHDRFGIEHGPGNIELSPADAARLFRWVDPALPVGWHGVTGRPSDGKPTIVNVRK